MIKETRPTEELLKDVDLVESILKQDGFSTLFRQGVRKHPDFKRNGSITLCNFATNQSINLTRLIKELSDKLIAIDSIAGNTND